MRIMAIDHGTKNIGIAISDPTGTIATPLKIIRHVSRAADVALIANLAQINDVKLIVVGQSFQENGTPSFQGRGAARFADSVYSETNLPVVLWDEGFTTVDAREAKKKLNTTRKKRKGHLDSMAAVILLQSYLDENVKK